MKRFCVQRLAPGFVLFSDIEQQIQQIEGDCEVS